MNRRWARLGLAAAWAAAAAWGCAAARAAIDGERALELIRAQCAFGPRVPGTPAHDRTRRWIGEQFRALGWHVEETTFTVRLPLNRQLVTACNIWVLPAADGPTSPALLLSAHWDTRPWADRDPSGARPAMLGANDGASGVAMLIELARALAEDPLRPQIALALWDAEDSGLNNGGADTWCLGSRAAAARPPRWIGRVRMGLNLDMVAGPDFSARMDTASLRAAPEALAALWRIGHDLYPSRFNLTETYEIIDDHLPWIEAGKPYINLLGLPYAHWHTAGDSPEHCSPAVLNAVGEVVMQWIRQKAWLEPGVFRGMPAR